MAKLTVEIVTPEKRILSVQADEAIVPGARGLFGVRPGHTPFLSLIEPGLLTLSGEGTPREAYFVAGGFVEVSQDKVLVLADVVEPVSAIDADAARRRLEEAQERLRGMPSDDVRFGIEQATVRRETARVNAAVTR